MVKLKLEKQFGQDCIVACFDPLKLLSPYYCQYHMGETIPSIDDFKKLERIIVSKLKTSFAEEVAKIHAEAYKSA